MGASLSAGPSPVTEFLGHPKGVFVCFFTEMWSASRSTE